MSCVASALDYAHSLCAADGTPLDIVHRDVSLSNVMVGYDGAVKLIDFGIAKAANRATKTQVGTLKGKIGYLAPEQILRKARRSPRRHLRARHRALRADDATRAFRETSDLDHARADHERRRHAAVGGRAAAIRPSSSAS